MRIKCLAQGNNILLPGLEPSNSVSNIDILANRPIFSICETSLDYKLSMAKSINRELCMLDNNSNKNIIKKVSYFFYYSRTRNLHLQGIT